MPISLELLALPEPALLAEFLEPPAPGDLGKRSQVDAVKASKTVPFGKLASGPAEGIGGFQGQICRPLPIKLTLR